MVYGARHQLLARATLTLNEHGRVSRSDAINELEDTLHRRRTASHAMHNYKLRAAGPAEASGEMLQIVDWSGHKHTHL